MKTFSLIALFFFIVTVGWSQSAQDNFQQGQKAFFTGDYKTAKSKLQLIDSGDRNYRPAQSYLKMIEAKEKQGGENDLKRRLEGVVLDEVNLKDATFGATLKYLGDRVEKQTNGEVKVNFVVQLPKDFLEKTPVTLVVQNMPFTEILRYLEGLAGVSFVIEKYAVVVKQR